MNNQNDRVTDFLKDGARTYYLGNRSEKIYVTEFQIDDTRVDIKNGTTEKYSAGGWIKYDIDAELARSLRNQGENRR